ncbi:hypothetical protein [Henriciella pelagia]|uniref:hypothetical protein n=1 Tax=Henriciella pelagia TaxID=1977912 RepID=UPI0035146205
MTDSKSLIERLEKLRAEATGGEWFSETVDEQDGHVEVTYICHPDTVCDDTAIAELMSVDLNAGGKVAKANAALIVELVKSLPTILSELKKAGEMREALKFYAAPEVYIDGPSLSKNIYVPYYRILEDRGEVARAALTNGERE